MLNDNSSYYKNDLDKKKEKDFKCSGCGLTMNNYDEKCPNCERLNPDYIYR